MQTPHDTGLTTRSHAMWLAGILLVSMAARLWCFELCIGDDDQRWIVSARELHAPRASELPAVYYGRILWRTLLAGWGNVAGLRLESSAVLMFGLAAASIVLVAALGRAAFGDRAGLLAATVYGLHPISVYYDVMTLPDGLAVPVLAAAAWCGLRAVRGGGAGWALAAGLLAGASFSIKEYFVGLAIPLGWAIWRWTPAGNPPAPSAGAHAGERADSAPRRDGGGGGRRLVLFVLGCAAGIAVDFLLHAWDNGDVFGHFKSFSAFAGYATTEHYSGLRRVAGQLARRIEIPQMLLLTCCGIGAWLMIGSVAWQAARWRRCAACRLLLSATALFMLFLCVMPLKLRPFTLVYVQARYLLCVLPFVAAGAGGMLVAAWARLRETELRWPAWALFALTLAWNVPATDDLPQKYNRWEFAAMQRCLARPAEFGAYDELIVPFGMDPVTAPDRFASYGVRLVVRKRLSLSEARECVLAHPQAAVFISESMVQHTLDSVDPLVAEDLRARRGDLSEFRAWLVSQGFRPYGVDVPDSALRRWTDRLGIRSRGVVVATVYVR